MDNLDIKTPMQPSTDDLRGEFDSLRHLVVSILILVFVLSGTLNLYLLRQYRSLSKELAEQGPRMEKITLDYQKGVPFMNNTVGKLADYARTHPDYVPVLSRYGFKPAAAASPAPASPASPAPPGQTSPKK
jgi:hypothetical protein